MVKKPLSIIYDARIEPKPNKKRSINSVKQFNTMTGTFEELVGSDEPVLIDFSAEWCKPCRKIDAMLNQLAEELDEDITIMKIDVDKNTALRKKYKIDAVPTLILFQNSKQLWRHTGLISVPEVVRAVNKAL